MTCSSVVPTPTVDPLDKAGVVVSTACLLHCLLLPLVIAAVPSFAHLGEGKELLHMIFASLSVPFVAFAMARGFRQHRSHVPLMIAFPGVALLWLSLLVHDPHWLESIITSVGAVMLGAGHLINHRMVCRCPEAG